ncbi:MAG: hypothetical protein RR521_04490 [Clostridia bacterium]
MTEKDITRALQANMEAIHFSARTRAAIRCATEKKVAPHKKLSFGLVLALVLALATVAIAAALHWNALEMLVGGNMQNADAVMQGKLHQEIVNDVEMTIQEAGYDGKTLWLSTSYRLLDVDTPFGKQNGGVSAELGEALQSHHVGWWMDAMWIDGQDTNMPADSYSTMDGSDVPGEIIVYEAWRLDHENVYLKGKTELALPIGDCQSVLDYSFKEHPERYTEDGKLKVPEKGMVTFSFTPNTAATVVEHPRIQAKLPDFTAQVAEVVYSPILTYIILDIETSPSALAAFIAPKGDDVASADRGMNVFGDWAKSLTLVDGAGNEVFTDVYEMDLNYSFGWNGHGDDYAEYLFPYSDHWPEEMYLAPIGENGADMSLAVKVK